MAIFKPGVDPGVGRNVTGFRLHLIPQWAGTDYTIILQIERGARCLPEDCCTPHYVDIHEAKAKHYDNLQLFGNGQGSPG